MISSYPSIFALGHRWLAELLLDPVLVQEKIDGSQISFGILDGILFVRSKGAQINVEAPDNMFARGVEVIKGLDLTPGWVYRGEYLTKPKHNTLAYDRTPANHIILFDINPIDAFAKIKAEFAPLPRLEEYLAPAEVRFEAGRLGLEVVPTLYEGMLSEAQEVHKLMDTVSCLGGSKIEGVVIKNYARFGADKKVLMGKYVSEAFKEVHGADWKLRNPNRADVLESITAKLKTPARWHKAVQHLKEAGTLEGSPRDIGALFKEVPTDVKKECEEQIKEMLFAWAWPKVSRGITQGLAEWYKELLLQEQFKEGEGGQPRPV